MDQTNTRAIDFYKQFQLEELPPPFTDKDDGTVNLRLVLELDPAAVVAIMVARKKPTR